MAIIKFVHCTSSLHYRLFHKLLTDITAEYQDLFIHNDIGRLGKGNTLKRFCELREELKLFVR